MDEQRNEPVQPVQVIKAPEPSRLILQTQAADVVQVIEPIKNKQRHFLAVFFLSFIWGVFGVDRFYLGKYFTGFLKLITFGGFGLWVMIDLSLIMAGAMTDRHGNEMLEYKRYKKFASRTVLIFSLVVCSIIVISGIELYFAITQLLQGGGLDNLLNFQNGLQTQMPTLDSSDLKSLGL